ncbi:hypothetical protein [Bradyrhizobium elkanii]|uniref:hypothetical protein n=1 Tax=Bradyrhizobium elkanii TaxID=29448 RepID=UPI0035151EBA
MRKRDQKKAYNEELSGIHRSPTAPAILAALASGPKSSPEIAAALSMSPDTIRWNVARMLRLNLIHIDSWRPRPMKGGRGAAVYAAGAGENAEYPLKDKRLVRAQSKQRSRTRQLARLHAGNPFGVLIAQVAA